MNIISHLRFLLSVCVEVLNSCFNSVLRRSRRVIFITKYGPSFGRFSMKSLFSRNCVRQTTQSYVLCLYAATGIYGHILVMEKILVKQYKCRMTSVQCAHSKGCWFSYFWLLTMLTFLHLFSIQWKWIGFEALILPYIFHWRKNVIWIGYEMTWSWFDN